MPAKNTIENATVVMSFFITGYHAPRN